MQIVILDGHAANPGDLSWDALKQFGKVDIYQRTAPQDTVRRLRDADIALTNKVFIGADEIAQLPKLKYIGVNATGYNVVDLDAAHRRGIVVTNVPAYSTMSVAQCVLAHLLNITNQVEQHSQLVNLGEWESCPDFCFFSPTLQELDGMTLGIVGLGNTGTAVARIAATFGMHVLALSSKSQEQLRAMGISKARDIDHLFSTSDVLSLHCPLTPDTHHIVNARTLALMKPTAILINTGRGPLVDEQALADALNSGQIHAAGLDVLAQEPPIDDSPLIGATNCHITPHTAWATRAARRRLIDTVVDNVRAFIAGKPRNVVLSDK